jgi:iron complex outermembrane receptor protein
MNKEFGAYRFYSTVTEGDREWTRTGFLNFVSQYDMSERMVLTSHLHYRKHFDRYQYCLPWVMSPAPFENEHWTDSYGGEVYSTITPVISGKLVAGGAFLKDMIESTNLKEHQQLRYAVFGEYTHLWFGWLGMDAGFRIDRHSDWGTMVSPQASLSYWFKRPWSVQFSAGQAFRCPTFTDLYYVTAGNQGNPDLVPEKAVSYETTINYHGSGNASLTAFYRDQEDVIDWVKLTASDSLWWAMNIGQVDIFGIETRYSFKVGGLSGQLHYTWIGEEKLHRTYLSKYALRYPRHQANLQLKYTLPGGIIPLVNLVYKERSDEPSYLVLNTKVTKVIGQWLQASIEGTNLLNTHYEEIPGVKRPGRWVGVGLSLEL